MNELRHPGAGRGPVATLAKRDTGLRRYDGKLVHAVLTDRNRTD
jgi:hypothetical protein